MVGEAKNPDKFLAKGQEPIPTKSKNFLKRRGPSFRTKIISQDMARFITIRTNFGHGVSVSRHYDSNESNPSHCMTLSHHIAMFGFVCHFFFFVD